MDRLNGNLRLQSNSPCINAGNNADVTTTTDLDGRPRIVEGTVDIGCYEYQGAGMGEFIGWLQQYSLPTDGSGDTTDPDLDLMNNWQEWQADTDPTNAASIFRVGSISAGPPVAITVPSSSARLYSLLFCTDLSAPIWLPVPGQTDVPGTGSLLTLIDPDPSSAAFYRVSVRFP